LLSIHERDDKFSKQWCISPRVGFELVTLGFDLISHFQHSLPLATPTKPQEYLLIPAWTLCELVEGSRSLDGLEVNWGQVMLSKRPVDALAGSIMEYLLEKAKMESQHGDRDPGRDGSEPGEETGEARPEMDEAEAEPETKASGQD